MIYRIFNKENYRNHELISKKPPYIIFKTLKNIKKHIVTIEINYHIIIAPFRVKSNSYKNKNLIYDKPPKIRQRFVTFKEDVDICILENKIERILSMEYYRGLMGKCTRAHHKIYNIFNDITNNFLTPLNIEPDDPIHIKDPSRSWDEDDSPLDILELWKEDPLSIKGHLNALERSTKVLNGDLLGIQINVLLPKVSVHGNCFQGILQARLSGKKFDKLSEKDLINKINNIDFSI